MNTIITLIIIALSEKFLTSAEKCPIPDNVALSQSIQNNGFHREIDWLLETDRFTNSCQIVLSLEVNSGMFVNPYQLADLKRMKLLSARVAGEVNVESPSHESTEHKVYIFLNGFDEGKRQINLPIHLRYQRANIGGGFGKVQLAKPDLLMNCDTICDDLPQAKAPCNSDSDQICIWYKITYQALFDEVELLVPIGDLNDYPLVSIVTLLLSCIGCIYILSILSSSSLPV